MSQHGQLGAIPPPPFLSLSPLGEHAKWACDTPPQKGYLSDTRAIPYENKANGRDTPLCDSISKGYCAIWGGISHWAAKLLGCTPRGRATTRLLRMVLRRVLEIVSENVLRRLPRRLLAVGFRGRKGSEKGS